MRTHREHPIRHLTDQGVKEETQALLAEEPLSIRVQGNPYPVVMRKIGIVAGRDGGGLREDG